MISKKFWIASIASIAAAGTLGIAVAQTSGGSAPNLNTPTDNQPASGAGSSKPMDSASGTSGASSPSGTSGAVGASTSSRTTTEAAPAAEQPKQADRG